MPRPPKIPPTAAASPLTSAQLLENNRVALAAHEAEWAMRYPPTGPKWQAPGGRPVRRPRTPPSFTAIINNHPRPRRYRDADMDGVTDYGGTWGVLRQARPATRPLVKTATRSGRPLCKERGPSTSRKPGHGASCSGRPRSSRSTTLGFSCGSSCGFVAYRTIDAVSLWLEVLEDEDSLANYRLLLFLGKDGLALNDQAECVYAFTAASMLDEHVLDAIRRTRDVRLARRDPKRPGLRRYDDVVPMRRGTHLNLKARGVNSRVRAFRLLQALRTAVPLPVDGMPGLALNFMEHGVTALFQTTREDLGGLYVNIVDRFSVTTVLSAAQVKYIPGVFDLALASGPARLPPSADAAGWETLMAPLLPVIHPKVAAILRGWTWGGVFKSIKPKNLIGNAKAGASAGVLPYSREFQLATKRRLVLPVSDHDPVAALARLCDRVRKAVNDLAAQPASE